MPCEEHGALRRFFTQQEQPLTVFPSTIFLRDPLVVNHIRAVLRMSPGEEVLLVDSAHEALYRGSLVTVQKQEVSVSLLERLPVVASALPPVYLGAALIKEQRWDWLLQKITELGARGLVPLQTQHTVVKVKDADKKLSRWQGVLASAAEQSEGMFIPQLSSPKTVAGFCDWAEGLTPTPGVKILLLERGADRSPLRELVRQQRTSAGAPWVVALGPEGGWSEGEIERFRERGFHPVSLGGRILRSETAAVALMSALAYEFDSPPTP
jgi:16S rRNA (uracil1498-N3)-methyltransferase